MSTGTGEQFERVDFWNLLAIQKRGMPAGWQWNSLDVKGHPAPREHCVARVLGAVCTATFKTGPRKGQTGWAKRDRATERELFVPFPEFDAFLREWEGATGRCHGCCGNGTDYNRRTCGRCSGSGKAGAR